MSIPCRSIFLYSLVLSQLLHLDFSLSIGVNINNNKLDGFFECSSDISKMKIYLARHGQDEDNANGILNGHRDMPLTELGENQAHLVAEKIQKAGLSFDAVYSSPLCRAKRTAQIILEKLGDLPQNELIILPELIERDFGIMTGTPTKEILQRCGEENVLKTDTITYFLNPEKAETFDDLIQRANQFLSQTMPKDYESILLVTHGDFGKMLYAAYYKLPWQDVLKQFHFGNSEVLLLSKDSSPDTAHVFQIQQYNS